MNHVVKFQSLNPASRNIFATFDRVQTNKLKTDMEILDIYETSAELLLIGSKGFGVLVGGQGYELFFKPSADPIPGRPKCFDLDVHEIKLKN